MNSVEIISKHLDISKLDNIEEIDSFCAFTGEKINEGIHKKHVIKDTFTDFGYLKAPSEYVSLDVAATMAEIIPGQKKDNSLRNYSFIANDKEIKLLKTSEIFPYIINPIDPPFCFCVSFNNKKHLAFKSTVNYSNREYIITTDMGDCKINVNKVHEILPVLQNWYTIMPGKEDTKMQQTWFTKDEILLGCHNYKKIQEYGNQYFKENKILESYRGTMFLKILVHCLIKTYKHVEA